jgi:hypothetical protein
MADSRPEVCARLLRDSRAELLALLRGAADGRVREFPPEFPRSRLLRSLLRGEGMIWILGLAAIAFVINPRFTARLARRVPVGLLGTKLLLPYLRGTDTPPHAGKDTHV